MTGVRDARVLVVAKAPVAGVAKTRVGADVGMDVAAGLAAGALLDTVRTCTAAVGADRCRLALAGELGDEQRPGRQGDPVTEVARPRRRQQPPEPAPHPRRSNHLDHPRHSRRRYKLAPPRPASDSRGGQTPAARLAPGSTPERRTDGV